MNDDILELLAELVRIDSQNPDLVAGAAGEAGVAAFIAEWARSNGLEVAVSEVEPGRPNVVVVARGTGGGRSLMINAHTDVVGVAGYVDPFVPHREPGRMYGRGVLDTKVGVATALVHAKRAAAAGLRGDVVVAAVVDEECGSKGTEALVADARWKTDAAIVIEPTERKIVHAHRGWCWGKVVVEGRAAHGSRPDLGVDAIVHAAPVLGGLGELQRRLAAAPHELLGAASVHASLVSGGSEMSTYPARLELDVERRLLPGESAATLHAELEALAAQVETPAAATVSTSAERSPLLLSPDEPIVQTMRAAGPELVVGASAFWTDAALLTDAGIPAVVFGPGGSGIHETEEWLDLESFAVFERVVWETVVRFCA